MSTQEVLEIVRKRGLSIYIKDGQPVLKTNGKSGEATPELLNVLTLHRERIIEAMTPKYDDPEGFNDRF